MLALSFKNLQENLSALTALQLSIFVIIFKTFSSAVLLEQKSSEIIKLKQYLITDYKLCLLGGFGGLIRRDFAKFEKTFLEIFETERVSQVRVSFSSIALKLAIAALFGTHRDLMIPITLCVYQQSLRASLAKILVFLDAVIFKA